MANDPGQRPSETTEDAVAAWIRRLAERPELPRSVTGPLETPAAPTMTAAAAAAPSTAPAARSLRELEKDGIIAALAATAGNKAQAAAILEIDRSTLYKKLKEYGLG